MCVRKNLDGLDNNEDSLTLDSKFHLLAFPCSIILQAFNTIMKKTTHMLSGNEKKIRQQFILLKMVLSHLDP
jgi:hypothetical protein